MNWEHVGNFHEVGTAEWAGMEVEEVVHACCMLLLVVRSAKLVLAVAKQWFGRRWLTWRFVAGYRRGLHVGTLFVM